MTIRLDEEINKLRKTILEMGNSVEDQINDAVKALKEKDTVLAKQVIRNDAMVNRLEVMIDKICLKIFALKQPIAYDLRFVASCLKVNNDLERMGDFATRIAEEAINLSHEIEVPDLLELYKLFEIGQQMVKLSLESFMHRNVEIAKEVINQDNLMDSHYEELIQKIGPLVHDDSERFEMGLALINIAKCLERIGDHATNISEQAIYLEDGEIIKHQGI